MLYDAVGELLYTNDGVVQPTHHTWNDLGQVNALYRNNGVNSAFAYGGDQRLSAITHAFPNGASNQSYSFTYNPAGQVASSSSSNPAYDWTAVYTVARGYGVDGQNKYTASGDLALSYDGRGNLANDGVTGFGYDVTDKLTSLSNGATLSYDAADRLARTTGGATTRFLHDGDQIIGEYDASGNVLRRYVPGPGADQPILVRGLRRERPNAAHSSSATDRPRLYGGAGTVLRAMPPINFQSAASRTQVCVTSKWSSAAVPSARVVRCVR